MVLCAGGGVLVEMVLCDGFGLDGLMSLLRLYQITGSPRTPFYD